MMVPQRLHSIGIDTSCAWSVETAGGNKASNWRQTQTLQTVQMVQALWSIARSAF